MSSPRAYKPATLEIMERFFIALEACRRAHLIKSYAAFCRENGIDKAHMYTQRKDRGRGFFEPGWMTPLVNGCGVSARWLLTGHGTMFAE